MCFLGCFVWLRRWLFPSFAEAACDNKGGKKGNMYRHKTECVTLTSSFHPTVDSTAFPLTSTDLITQIGEETILYMSDPLKLHFFFLPSAMFCLTEANLKQLPNKKMDGLDIHMCICIFYYILISSVFHQDFGIFIQHVKVQPCPSYFQPLSDKQKFK